MVLGQTVAHQRAERGPGQLAEVRFAVEDTFGARCGRAGPKRRMPGRREVGDGAKRENVDR